MSDDERLRRLGDAMTDDIRSRLEALRDVRQSGTSTYRLGWNAALDAVLAALPVAPPPDLVALVRELQAHAREHNWQDVDEPIAALLAYPLPAHGTPRRPRTNDTAPIT
jgi:hypothetical protein